MTKQLSEMYFQADLISLSNCLNQSKSQNESAAGGRLTFLSTQTGRDGQPGSLSPGGGDFDYLF